MKRPRYRILLSRIPSLHEPTSYLTSSIPNTPTCIVCPVLLDPIFTLIVVTLIPQPQSRFLPYCPVLRSCNMSCLFCLSPPRPRRPRYSPDRPSNHHRHHIQQPSPPRPFMSDRHDDSYNQYYARPQPSQGGHEDSYGPPRRASTNRATPLPPIPLGTTETTYRRSSRVHKRRYAYRGQ